MALDDPDELVFGHQAVRMQRGFLVTLSCASWNGEPRCPSSRSARSVGRRRPRPTAGRPPAASSHS